MNEACNLLDKADEETWPIWFDFYVSRTAVAEAFASGRYEVLPDEAAHDRALERALEAGPSFRVLLTDPTLANIVGVTVEVGHAVEAHPLQRLATDARESAMDVVRRHCIAAFNGLPIAVRRQLLEADAAARARRAALGLSHRAEVGETDLLRGRFRRSTVGWVLTEH